MIPPSQESNDFKNSLAALLSKGNPLMPGGKKPNAPAKKAPVEEEEQKEKIKFDIFNNLEEESPDYKKKTVLDNVSSIAAKNKT
jgi:hypothetical protein